MTDQPFRREAGSEATPKSSVDLVQWLTEQIDQDEQVARAATDGPWVAADAGSGYDEYRIDPDVVEPGYEGGGVQTRADADHIVRHDPARVLRQVAAHRAIVARHKPTPGEEHIVCDIDSFVGHDDTEGLYGDPYPCADVRALAAIYSDHPDYNPAWTKGS